MMEDTSILFGRELYSLENQIKLIYRRISNIQTTYMYEVAKSVMKTKPQTIILEDLNIKGMMQNPKLAKALQEQNLYKFRQIIAYKGEKNGIRVKNVSVRFEC